jgi:hypothetical protein
MNRRCWLLLVVLIVALGSVPVTCDAAEFDDLAAELRTAMAQRDLPGAAKKLAEVQAAAKSDADKVTAERLHMLHSYLLDFWKSVHAGGNSLRGADELVIGDKRVAVVEYDEEAGKLVLRVNGQNKRYTLKDIPPRVALTLSEQVLKKGAPENEAFIGTFLAMDGKGDRKLAREAWDRATKAGVDVKSLLPELAIPLPAGATIEIPTLTPATAAALRPQFWSVMQSTDKGSKAAELGEQATQNAQGQLELKLAAGSTPVWITFKRKMPANFGLRMYLVDLPPDQKLGLFHGKENETDAYVKLPAGLAKVEFARQGGKFICRINDEDAAITVVDAATAKTTSVLGFTLPAGATCVIAGCEFAAR